MAKKKGYLNLLNCHFVISLSSTSYYTSSERGESRLSADKKILDYFVIKTYFTSIFLSSTEVKQMSSTFWVVT